jgi:cardiolipin synthase
MMPADSDRREPTRWRSGLRRHGLARRPVDLRDALGRRGPRFTDGNAIELFESGESAYPAMLEAIDSARKFVHLETYILRSDVTGRRFVEALADRAADGVEVRLLYDAIGSRRLDPYALEPLRRAGGEIVVFNPLRRVYPDWAPRRRDHRKLLIVDGLEAFTGGLNIGDEYAAGAETRDGVVGWRDTHARVEGPAVRDLGAVFLESWFRAGGAELPWDSLLGVQPPTCGAIRCGVLPDGPVYRRRAMRDLLVSALDSTQETARLTSPYFAPDAQVLEALERTAERGVRVELILAGPTDHPILRRGARATVERLLRRGVAIHEYRAGILHAKNAVFDQRVAIVGSSNLDRQSLQHNYEVNLVALGDEVASRLNRIFEADLDRAVEITLEGLARRQWFERLTDWLSASLVKALF